MIIPEHLFKDLPDADSVRRFVERMSEGNQTHFRSLIKDEALLSDVLTLVAHSPLLSETLLQNPEYIGWLKRRRLDSGVRRKEELLESLARFALTNSQLDHHILFARFRRRELLRIFLADIRRQITVAEITEELSNLADAVLENALRIAKQELDNRYGAPHENDENLRERSSEFCVVSLGKLGSKELNYASDIDLMFLYSSEGETSGNGKRGKITNREYFVKLGEQIAKIVGQQTGEGATFRVDLRLRPHGRVGPLAMSVADTSRYYLTEAADWERQVLIRSRCSAGDASLFRKFFALVEKSVFSSDKSVAAALRSVRLSKQRIDLEQHAERGFDVKLGKGGIREIEFIAQALQIAYGGRDVWLRSSHTLISLSRLADRGLIKESETSELFDAYDFLRRLEHILQMENGLQTHLVPNEAAKRNLLTQRMGFETTALFDETLKTHTDSVNRIFRKIFSEEGIESSTKTTRSDDFSNVSLSLQDIEGPVSDHLSEITFSYASKLSAISNRFAEMNSADPLLIATLPNLNKDFPIVDYGSAFKKAVLDLSNFRAQLAALRKEWGKQMFAIVTFDTAEKLSLKESKYHQTRLAETCIAVAIELSRQELERRYKAKVESLDLAVMGLGKLGGAGIDYGSDLDLVLLYDDTSPIAIPNISHSEYYARAAESFVNILSSMTREGSLYRVDLRLRPHGKNGPIVISRRSFAEYLRHTAAIWEMLAFVKIRAAAGSDGLASSVEKEVTTIIHDRAFSIPKDELANETRRIRERLESERSAGRRSRDIDIKFGQGGMLDIYFAIRFLQLRDNIPDDPKNRSSDQMLDLLRLKGSISDIDFQQLSAGYRFLSNLDHQLRLLIGRSTLLPNANQLVLEKIALRMGIESPEQLVEQLSIHRIGIRESFDSILFG